ncbi:MAG: ArnT family glycosyltransferase, partial [Pirellulales bacterium]
MPDLLLQTALPGSAQEPPVWRIGWLADRSGVLATAALLVAAALGYGSLVLRGLAAGVSFSPTERAFYTYALGTAALSLATLLAGLAGLLFRGGALVFLVAGPVAAAALAIRTSWARARTATNSSRHSGSAPPGATRSVGVPSAAGGAWPAGPGSRSQGTAGQAASGTQQGQTDQDTGAGQRDHRRRRIAWLLVAVPFVLLMLAGAMLPPLNFDVKEYHLQAPKEFFLQGRISFLPHNVYANMPAGTEMLSLLAMVAAGDWWSGALAGKVVLCTLVVMTGAGLLAAGRRLFGAKAGVFAAVIFLTTPWSYRLATTAFVEGGFAFFLLGAFYAALRAMEAGAQREAAPAGADSHAEMRGGAPLGKPAPAPGDKAGGAMASQRGAASTRLTLLAGLLAGAAAACKYPGVLYGVLPVLGLAAWTAFGRFAGRSSAANQGRGWAVRPLVAAALGVAVTLGPWLAKNAVLAGNPTYPLLYGVFGGQSWTAEKNAKWLRVHLPHSFAARDLGEKLLNVVARSDWQSPLVFGLAPFALAIAGLRRRALLPAGFVVFVIAVWWLATHRIDRFWVPVLPVAALVAGAGATWSSTLPWRIALGTVVCASALFNLALCTT